MLATHEPSELKALGQKVQNFEQSLWDANKFSIVTHGNRLKFTSTPEMTAALVATTDYGLAEASPFDK